MTYKKNWVGVCLWAFYALAAFLGYAKALYDVLQAPHVTNHYIQFGIVFLSFALVTAVFIQIRKLANLLKRPVHVLWEALLFVLLFATGVFLRIYFIGRGTEHAAYFETAMVNGSPVTTLAHGAQYFYVLLLRGLFLLTDMLTDVCRHRMVSGDEKTFGTHGCVGFIWRSDAYTRQYMGRLIVFPEDAVHAVVRYCTLDDRAYVQKAVSKGTF